MRPLVPPVFWTADPYGFRGVPLDVVRELMSLSRSELMITFMVRDIVASSESRITKRP